MWVKAVIILALSSAGVVSSDDQDFSVVSPSPCPSDIQQLNDCLVKIKAKLDSQCKLNESFPILTERQTEYENVTFKMENLKNQLTKLKFQNKQILQRLKKMTFEMENLKTQPRDIGHRLPKSCKEAKQMGGNTTKAYLIEPIPSVSFHVLCDMETRGGGWTYIHKRFDGSQLFPLNWDEYESGFGKLSGEFWLGLEHLHQLTDQEPNELLVELVNWDQQKVYAHYNRFIVGSDVESYPLKSVGNYSGDAGDSLSQHVGAKFSTHDRDNDGDPSNCAAKWDTAWWFLKGCSDSFSSQLNGRYRPGYLSKGGAHGLQWYTFTGNRRSLKEAKMMIRPN